MTTLLLIRHGSTDAVGHRLVGRLPGAHLDRRGVSQAGRLARRLGRDQLAAVFSSPMVRAIETAAPIALAQGLEVEPRAGLDEIDFGDWSGKTFEELAPLPGWRRFNQVRSCARVPGGEHIAEVQARVVGELERIAAAYPDRPVAVVSHADVIRTALAYYMAVPIDLFLRIEVSPASVSTIELGDGGPRITGINVPG